MAIYSAREFGDLNKEDYGLTELPCLERAGLIWVTLTPNSELDISLFLSGYDSLLSEFGFDKWHHQKTQRVEGPNWKVAYDGYLDYYHLPILHRETLVLKSGTKRIITAGGRTREWVGRMKRSKSLKIWPMRIGQMIGSWQVFGQYSLIFLLRVFMVGAAQ